MIENSTEKYPVYSFFPTKEEFEKVKTALGKLLVDIEGVSRDHKQLNSYFTNFLNNEYDPFVRKQAKFRVFIILVLIVVLVLEIVRLFVH